MLITLAGIFWKVIPGNVRRWLIRLVHPTFTVSAAGIITNERGEVLLLNHVLRGSVSGWGLPGGFLEAGEQPEEALRREIMEETGIELIDVRLYSCRIMRRHVETIMIAKSVGEAAVRSREISELGWYPIDHMPAEMSLNQKLVIRKALAPKD
ncbi:hypothetical protein BH20ACI2_BH20ACI2_20680 [soil metagenome]